MYVGMSQLHRERNDLAAATGDLLRSQELGEHAGSPQNPYRWRVAMARIREAEGDLDGALDLLDEAERVYASDHFPNVRPVPAMRARVWVAQGRLAEAASWAREQGLSATDDLSYLREFEHITLSRVLLARHTKEAMTRPLHEEPSSWSGSCQRPRTGAGQEVSSRSWCCRHLPTRRKATFLPRLPH